MRDMKDSGVEWIGEIPAHWNLVRLKSLIEARDGGAWGEEAAGKDGDMICLRIADFDYQRYCFKSHGELTVRHYKPDVIDRLRLMPGDILVEKSGGGEKTPVGRAVIFDKDYPALYANFMDRLRCKDGINPQWVLYNWANLYANNYTRPYIKQTTGIQNLDISALLSSQFIALPSVGEQEKILDAVLSESKKVDALIENVQAQIVKLKAYKQSVITEVVTKGLDPTAPMKDSGVEWIGEIPAHWEIKRGKALFKETEARSSDGSEELLTVSQYTGITPRSQKNVTMFEALSLEGYKICEIGDIAANTMWLWAGAIGVSEYRGVISPSYNVYRQRSDNFVPRYLDYLLRAPMLVQEYASLSTGIRASRLRLYPKDFFNIMFPVPPIEEQQAILDTLSSKFSAVDRLIAIKQVKIEKLEQYKSSLIYEYVTGKREVV